MNYVMKVKDKTNRRSLILGYVNILVITVKPVVLIGSLHALRVKFLLCATSFINTFTLMKMSAEAPRICTSLMPLQEVKRAKFTPGFDIRTRSSFGIRPKDNFCLWVVHQLKHLLCDRVARFNFRLGVTV